MQFLNHMFSNVTNIGKHWLGTKSATRVLHDFPKVRAELPLGNLTELPSRWPVSGDGQNIDT